MLLAGAAKARVRSAAFMSEVRNAVGLRSLSAQTQNPKTKEAKTVLATFKQYREKDGQFYFKLVDAQGITLLQSFGFTSPRDAGSAIAQLVENGASALETLQAHLEHIAPQANDIILETLNLLRETSKK